jgi:hypothetical protein
MLTTSRWCSTLMLACCVLWFYGILVPAACCCNQTARGSPSPLWGPLVPACVHLCLWHTPAKGTAVSVSGCELNKPQLTAAADRDDFRHSTVCAYLNSACPACAAAAKRHRPHHQPAIAPHSSEGLTPERPCTIERHKTSSHL